jgi:AraC family transcriptional regulator, exoenzyme S synthesis regulatory protein ExsA
LSGKWLLEKKLSHAIHLLPNAGKTVSENTFASGFKNTSHFNRSFIERYGMSPTTIRQLRSA